MITTSLPRQGCSLSPLLEGGNNQEDRPRAAAGGFVIFDKERFEDEVMAHYFQGSKYSSFTRRLRRWNFQSARVATSKKARRYWHPMFQCGNFELAFNMVAVPQPRKKKTSSAGAGVVGTIMPSLVSGTEYIASDFLEQAQQDENPSYSFTDKENNNTSSTSSATSYQSFLPNIPAVPSLMHVGHQYTSQENGQELQFGVGSSSSRYLNSTATYQPWHFQQQQQQQHQQQQQQQHQQYDYATTSSIIRHQHSNQSFPPHHNQFPSLISPAFGSCHDDGHTASHSDLQHRVGPGRYNSTPHYHQDHNSVSCTEDTARVALMHSPYWRQERFRRTHAPFGY